MVFVGMHEVQGSIPSATGQEEDWALLTGGSEKDLVGKKKWSSRKQELNFRVQSILFSERPASTGLISA